LESAVPQKSFCPLTDFHFALESSLFFRYIVRMAFFTQDRGQKQYVVICKGCHRNVPAGVTEMPTQYIAVKCVLCREHRRYLPTEVGLDFVHYEVRKQVRKWAT
jgi:hypothetical protein